MRLPIATKPSAVKLLERSAELDRLSAFLSAARSGEGRLVFVGGEAGAGKTSLVQAFSQSIKASIPVLIGRSDPLSAPLPLGPLIDVASALGGELEALLRTGAPIEAFAAVVRLLKVGPGATVLILEDLHWADGATLDFVRFLGRRLGSIPALVIVTYRDDELGPQHPLRVAIGDLATTPGVYRIALAPLSVEAVRLLAEGSEFDPGLLHSRTGGNPFLVSEALAFSNRGTPPTVRDAVLARAARLSDSARQTLEAAAVIGLRSESWLLTAVSPSGIEECCSTGMLRIDDDLFAFRHELTRDAFLESILPSRQRMIHAAVLNALQTMPGGFNDLSRLAHHAEGAGDAEAVMRYAPAAAERAVAARAHRQAAEQYARAVRFGNNLAAQARADLLERFANECAESDRLDEAIEARRAAIEIRDQTGDRLRQGDDLRLLSMDLALVGNAREARDLGQVAVTLLEQLPAGQQLALAYGELARQKIEFGEISDATTLAEKAVAAAELAGDPESRAVAAIHLGDAFVRAGRHQRGLELITGALNLARDSSLEHVVPRALQRLVIQGILARNHALTEGYLNELFEFYSKRELTGTAWALGFMARNLFHQGRWKEAEDAAAAALRSTNPRVLHRFYGVFTLGHLRARQGDEDEAARALDEALELATLSQTYEWMGSVRAARAEAAWLAGKPQNAVLEAEAIYDRAATIGDPWMVGELAFWMWRAGRQPSLKNDSVTPYPQEIEGNWKAAAAMWRARGRPYEEARALAESGDASELRRALAQFERLGARPAAALVTRRLRTLGARNIPRGPRKATRRNPHQLTEREAEILTLLAKGFRNADIADRLYLSAKTVDHHVSSILGKLGVHSRFEAVLVAGTLGQIEGATRQK